MKRKLLFLITVSAVFAACGGSESNKDETATGTEKANATAPADTQATAGSSGVESKGIGKFKNVELTHPLDEKMIASGKSVYDVKCGSCHKLSEEKLVGPGWKGVTDRRSPEWIMNFVTNTEEMLDKDAAAKNLYEICLVKMPNQNLGDDDARHVLEFMRNNDGKK
jgi:cytochrome c5